MPRRDSSRATPVYLELGPKRTFASAAEWPGWSRSGKGEESALSTLAGYADRYRVVPDLAGVPFAPVTAAAFEVVERLPGSATTDFGAPGAVAAAEAAPLRGAELDRTVALLEAAWAVLDRVAAGAPAELRKGPRGGGRDKDAIVAHVANAESAYVRKLGTKVREPASGGRAAVAALRRSIVDALRAAPVPSPPRGWPARYAARRIAWHALDHAWEIEDRSEPARG